jgi:hypothetical protein
MILAYLLGFVIGVVALGIILVCKRKAQWLDYSGPPIDDAQRAQLDHDLARVRAKYGMDK